jgi:hypothetical protein
MKTVFLRVIEADDKAAALLDAVREPGRAKGRQRFELDLRSFASMPSSPFAYWIGPSLISVFHRPDWQTGVTREARNGLGTLDDFRFVRLAVEVLPAAGAGAATWRPFSKGGRRAPFYQDVVACVCWRGDGAEVKAHVEHFYKGGHWSRSARSVDYYFRPGITWPLRGVRFSAQAVPKGGIFSPGGKMLFANDSDLLLLLAFLNSDAFDLLVRVFAGKVGGVQYQSGLIEQIPIAVPDDVGVRRRLESLARRALVLGLSLDTCTETSHAFTMPALLQVAGVDLATRVTTWSQRVCALEDELAAIQAEINERCFALYGIDEADRRAVTEGFGGLGADEVSSDGTNDAEDNTGSDIDERESTADSTALAAELVSWAVGVAFGRFDIRLAIGARVMLTEPGPFEPLPACSPGMLTGEDGLPLARPPAGYPFVYPEAGVLVADLGHAADLSRSVRAVFDVVFGVGADRWWSDMAALLDPKSHELRVWLAGSFFEHHLERNSKSHRKAPIVWQLGTPSGCYSVWLYAHRLTRDSFFQLQNEVVGPKLIHEERQLTSLMQNAGGSPSAPERKEIAAQEGVVDELRAMLDEVKRVAPLWNPNLDDGVVLAMAPLWRLVPQHKPWQKELKAKWDELAAGKYHWAHLAMHLWPERVVPKCATDRSLAIAHGLDDVFWVEGTDGKWQHRPVPTRSVDELVRERTSPSVAAALKSLLDAPVAAAGGGDGRRRKSRVDRRRP